jgi:peroxiredoxin
MVKIFRIAAAAALAAVPGAVHAAGAPAGHDPPAAVEPGAPAPPFELVRFDGGTVRSSELFSAHDETFLVFWWSLCPHCVEALHGCERFFREYGGGDVTLLGIDGDERLLEARAAVAAGSITFPQARDEGGAIAAAYGVPRETFTVILVDAPGVVRSVRIDPAGELRGTMEEMLSSPRTAPAVAATAGSGAAAPSEREGGPEAGGPSGADRTTVRGLQRIRFLAIDTGAGEEAAGLYGEPVRSLRSVQYRLEVEASRRLAPHLRAGGLLRISNEGEDVLEAGPEYFGSQWGSAFAEFDAAAFSARVGYFTLSMTPLTFMRWDWDDNPRVGGDTGCGCGAPAAGTLLVGSLEELGPDLTVEGVLASYDAGSAEAVAFYAVPRRALGTGYSAYRYAGEDRARYSEEIAGFQMRWRHPDRRTGLSWKAGVHALATFEDDRSVDFQALGYSSPAPWVDTWTVTATAEIPVVRGARLRGEIVLRNATSEHGVLEDARYIDILRGGGGGFGGIVLGLSPRLRIAIDYLRLSPDFYAPFSALSYESNTEGARASARVALPGDLASLSLFYKRLRDADPIGPGIERLQTSLAGASVDFTLRGFVGGSIGWLEKRSRRDGALSPVDSRRRSLVASVERDFGRAGVLRLQYERDRGRDAAVDPAADPGADLYSLYSSIGF